MAKKLTILIIDDNPEDLEFYTNLLKQGEGDYDIFTAQDGEEALMLSKDKNIDCTFVDYYLPEMNGMKILEALQKQAGNDILPAVILTGEPNQTIQAEAARKGALDYIVKDVTNTPEQIEAVIRKTMDWADGLRNKKTAAG